MSRSYKKNPIFGITCKESEKKDKRLANRKLRRMIKQKLDEDIEILPELLEISNNWSFAKDGKWYYNEVNCIAKQEKLKKLMRK